MIIVITGKNGSGKTLHCVSLLRQIQKDDPERQIYTNIRNCQYGKQLEDNDWRKLPDSSYVVYDECQKIFPPRSHNKTIPPVLMDMAEHRHRGFDLVFITQHPTHFDHYIRQLCNKHYHVTRRAGLSASIIYSHDEIFDPTDKQALRLIDKTVVKFDKKLFDKYHSSFSHNYKVKLPTKGKLALIGIPLIAVMMYFMFGDIMTTYKPKQNKTPPSQPTQQNNHTPTQPTHTNQTAITQHYKQPDYKKYVKHETNYHVQDGSILYHLAQFDIEPSSYKMLSFKKRLALTRYKREQGIKTCVTSPTTCNCYSNGYPHLFPDTKSCLLIASLN